MWRPEKKTETFTQAEGFDSEGSWIDRNIRDMWKQDEQLLDNEGFQFNARKLHGQTALAMENCNHCEIPRQ